MSSRYDFTIKKGETFTRVITWKDENKVIINLTGYFARMHIRESVEDSATVIILTTENGRIALGGVLGTITLTITNTDTSALTVNSGFYDLELISGSGVVTRLIEGEVLITNEVTR